MVVNTQCRISIIIESLRLRKGVVIKERLDTTHATVDQAIRMQKFGVMVDVDLSSNIATGALLWENAAEASKTVFWISEGSSNDYAHAGRDQILAPENGVAETYYPVFSKQTMQFRRQWTSRKKTLPQPSPVELGPSDSLSNAFPKPFSFSKGF